MANRIVSDYSDFIDLVSGKIKGSMRKFINSGKFTRNRANGGKVSVSIPQVNDPRLVHGDNGQGVGRGPGKEGDVLRKGDKGQGRGNKAGDDTSEGYTVQIEMEEFVKFMGEELELPNPKQKPNQVFEEYRIKYNDISLIGPAALRDIKRTWKEAFKRKCAEGKQDELTYIPGCPTPVNIVSPIRRDMRYKKYNQIVELSNNALIVFARDGSYSMDEKRCEIASNVAWWIDVWIRSFYKRVDRLFVWHDSIAKEVDEDTFYGLRGGGGTKCSSAFKYIADQFENRYPPDKWNIYVFYFTDGENLYSDNDSLIEVLKNDFNPSKVNFTGVTQILCRDRANSVKNLLENSLEAKELDKEYFKVAEIGPKVGNSYVSLSQDETDQQSIEAIKHLLGSKKKK